MRRFDINLFIENAKTLDYIELLKLSQKEAIEVEKINITPKSSLKEYEWEIKRFSKFLAGLNFILINGIRPNSMDADELQNIRPIFENLVEKGQWKIEGLKIFDN